MHARSCVLPKGLGHERRIEPVGASHAAHQTAEYHCIVGGFQGVGLMVEVDFELTDPAFCYDHVCG